MGTHFVSPALNWNLFNSPSLLTDFQAGPGYLAHYIGYLAPNM